MNRFTQPTMNHHQTPPPHRKQRRLTKENSDPNLRSPALVGKPSPATSTAKTKSPLPPRPPRPLKRKLSVDSVPPENVHPGCSSDSGVKVVVRMRPPINEEKSGDIIVQRMSSDSLSINGQIFTFDSVADTTSSQDDIFHLVGAPLVENCLSGFNSSVFSYGQTGSGKTYTMWGPANTLLGENVSSELLGLTPRVLRRLFTRIKEEEINHADKQLIYQCRCSFLEIYNEQITDLLDPSQRNLHIREDIKSGVYVENLTEEYVPTMEDVIQILMKGLSNRRTGATTINAESSRSHSVFTCVVESRCKSVSDGLSSFKTSRINLVDLAGSERQKSTGAAGERLKEAGNINRSLSQLGNLINILAEVSQTGKQRHIPYRDSKLTFLLQESLGGNAKLAMICAISPSQSCKSETLSTLRFAQRAKAIKNKAVVNEVMQDDVNFLREVIRQLKDELLRMKENRSQTDPTGGYSTGWNARRSLNLLKFNLNRPMILPHVDNDSDVEMEIVEEANQLLVQLQDNKLSTAADGSNLETEEGDKDTDVTMEELISEEVDKHEISAVHCGESLHTIKPLKDNYVTPQNQSEGNDTDNSIHSQDKKRVKDSSANTIRQCLSSSSSIVDKEAKNSTVNDTSKDMLINSVNTPSPCKLYSVLKSPTPSVSPTVNTNNPTQLRINISPPTEHLAASLHQGLEYIKNNRKSNALRRSSFSGSCKPTGINPTFPLNRVDVGVQTCPQESELVEKNSQPFLCTKCKTVNYQEDSKNTNETSNLELVPVAELESVEKTKIIVPKAVEKVLAGAIRREMAMEEFCNKQNTEIMQLNRLVQLYKHERECNTILGQTREDKITRLETRINDIMTTEDYVNDELASLKNENMYLKEKYKNHPEVLEAEIEFKRIQEELEQYRIFFELGEKGVLLEEIKDLRSQLQYYMDSSATSAIIQSPLLQLTYPCEPIESKHVEKLADMKIELEASLSLSDKLKRELEFEKICSEELKKAMQMAMEGHTRMLEQYADLEEKHIQLLSRHREIQNGINDVKKAARRAGVRGAESKFINALAAEISALKVEKEKERQYLRDENKGLQSQLGDMANAVQAAGELLVRLKEAEEAVAIFQNRAMEAEKETEKAYKHINRLKRKHDKEINSLHELLEKSRLRSKQSPNNAVKCDIGQSQNRDGRQQREEFHLCQNSVEGELSKPEEPPSWFSGYDRCNI